MQLVRTTGKSLAIITAIGGLGIAIVCASSREQTRHANAADVEASPTPKSRATPIISQERSYQFTSKSVIAVTSGDVRRLMGEVNNEAQPTIPSTAAGDTAKR